MGSWQRQWWLEDIPAAEDELDGVSMLSIDGRTWLHACTLCSVTMDNPLPAVPASANPSESALPTSALPPPNLPLSNPPKIHDKGKGCARPISAPEILLSAQPATPLYALRGQKQPAQDEVILDSSDEYEEEDSGEEEVMLKKSDISATSSMPQVHVEVPSPPKPRAWRALDPCKLSAKGDVSHSYTHMCSYAHITLRKCADHVLQRGRTSVYLRVSPVANGSSWSAKPVQTWRNPANLRPGGDCH